MPTALVGRSWTWVTSGGRHVLTFAADGGSTSDALLDARPGEQGLTRASAVSTRKKTDSCSGELLADDAIAQETITSA